MRVSKLFAALCLLLPSLSLAQVTQPDSSANRERILLVVPPALLGVPVPVEMGSVARVAPAPLGRVVQMPRPPGADTTRPKNNLFGDYSDLGLQMQARIEAKGERTRNERCNSSQFFNPVASCNGTVQPNFNFQFNLKSNGTVADRFHVNIDYDSQREFEASNNLSVYYEGQPGEKLQRVELGSVNFSPPASRFITAGIPAGNYGMQAIGQFGPLRVRTIAAQQKGNVVQSREFTIGDKTLQANARDIEDYQIEPRRLFFTVDPRLFQGYPNIDLLDRGQMGRLRDQLPDTLRPTRVRLYRLQFGTQPQNPNGPKFRLIGDPSGGRQTYDLLSEGVDYYIDPSLLWVCLVRPLNPSNERLVVAFSVRIGGHDTTWATAGGTPDVQATPADQFANLVWDPSVSPSSPAFPREIRSVYRIAGGELQRQTTTVRVTAGAGDQEKPIAGTADTYLQMLGLSQSNNSAQFDVENRLWPRPSDPVYNMNAGAGDARGGSSRIIPDYFLIFPSLHPFSQRDSGLITPGNPTNDAIYSIPGEYLYSPQHPASIYHLRVSYQAEGSSESGALSLGSIQLRRGSERVAIDGRALIRDADYRIDYDLGRVTFTRPDTLFPQPRRVTVSYEENPLFAPAPTTLLGLTSELPMTHGQLNFTAISQSQSTAFTRPQLGFEPVSSLLAGVSGQFAWDAPLLTRLLGHLPFGATTAPSKLQFQGEFATSHPQPNSAGQAYIESFEGQGGVNITLADPQWLYSSIPSKRATLGALFPGLFDSPGASASSFRATTMAWQNNGTTDGKAVTFTISQIDPLTDLAGTGFETPEQILWLELYPLSVGGRFNRDSAHIANPRAFDWTVAGAPSGVRRFRSIRTVLNSAGVDLTRSEYIEFWTLLDTSIVSRAKNPTLIFDFGDVSENSLAFAPETLRVVTNARGGLDSLFSGKKLQGFDSLNTERDPFSHAFNVDQNDTGLPGDVVDTLVVIGPAGVSRQLSVPMCQGFDRALQVLGDTRTDCTRRNNRLDEEDIDADGVMNFKEAQRESERILRYIVDLSDPSRFVRTGGGAIVDDALAPGGKRAKQWVLIRIPFGVPADSSPDVQRRRIRALRLTVVSGRQADDNEFTQLPIARLKLVGAPWLKRNNQTVAGIAGNQPAGGFVVTSIIGTADRDSLHGVFYESPPGVSDQLDTKTGQFQPGVVQINEQSMRILAGSDMPKFARAEAYFRFPNGEQNFMGYQELRLWGRGRKNGWGQSGELQMFVKLGRDENNFYMYRTPVNAGQGQGAWLPEIHVDFNRFYDLRKRLQNAYLHGRPDSLACAGTDSALIARSGLPVGTTVHRFAACDGGYMVYTIEPSVTPPNLAAVQEMSVGIVRVADNGSGPGAILPGDTLELWVDDIRLSHVVSTAGYAGQVGLNFVAADFAEVRLNMSRKDPNFRQLGQQPTFINEQALDLVSTVHLEKLLPKRLGLAMPLTVTKTSSANDPLFLSHTDIQGAGIDGLRAPRTDVTTYSLALRLTTPIKESIFGPLFNNLSATSSYVSGGNQTEYQTGSTHNFNFAVDYLVADSARLTQLPGWMDRVLGIVPDFLQTGPIEALRGSVFRWNPTQFHLSSGIATGSDRRFSFIKPAGAPDDQGRLSLGLTNLWRNGATLEFRPTNALSLRWDLVSLRDLRQYGDSNQIVREVSAERSRLFGMNAGLERERAMQTSFSFAPRISEWLRPRADFGTSYSMLRDPNSHTLVGSDSVLPRRLAASQTLGLGTTVDLARLLTVYSRDSTIARRLAGVFAPVDVNFNRSLLSAFDAASFGPPVGYQFGFGSAESFRAVGGSPATSAGETTTLSANNALSLPFGTALVNRFRHTATLNWIQRLAGTQDRVDGQQTIFPDFSLRWSYRPQLLAPFVSGVGLNVGYSDAIAATSLPGALGGGAPELRRSRVQTYPLNGSVSWGFGGGLSTGAGYTHSDRLDSLPGSINRGNTNDLNFDVGRSFRVPQSWGLGIKNDLRTRFAYQQSHTQTYVLDTQSAASSRLQDNGRTAFNMNADTDLSETLLFTLQASHVVTFDNNFNRRITQLVLSTVLQIQFFGGQLK